MGAIRLLRAVYWGLNGLSLTFEIAVATGIWTARTLGCLPNGAIAQGLRGLATSPNSTILAGAWAAGTVSSAPVLVASPTCWVQLSVISIYSIGAFIVVGCVAIVIISSLVAHRLFHGKVIDEPVSLLVAQEHPNG